MTTIKAHIDAGHYPKDQKGRALVPMRNSEFAVVLATDLGGVVGWRSSSQLAIWSADGRFGHIDTDSRDLLPPPPRKVPVKLWAELDATGKVIAYGVSGEYSAAGASSCMTILARQGIGHRRVALTGEYEEPWS